MAPPAPQELLYERRGVFRAFCLMNKEHNLIRPTFTNPVNIDDLPTEYTIRHKDSDFLFTTEFDTLPRPKALAHTASERPENFRKNRYNDIKACDHTRVKLTELPNVPGSNYINANFITGYNNRKTFIATQGALESTIGDFWRMVYEHSVKIIIMVTNLRERGREQCAKYWPDELDTEPVIVDLAADNTLEVQSVDATHYADYTVREFVLRPLARPPPASPTSAHSKTPSRGDATTQPSSPLLAAPSVSASMGAAAPSSPHARASLHEPPPPRRPPSRANRSEFASSPSPRPENDYANLPNARRPPSAHSHRSQQRPMSAGESVRVVQYHFTNWSDYKAPDCTTALLRLIGKLRKNEDYNSHPVVVHCSAGVGRTGTLIAVDYLLDQCKQEGRVDVFGCVSSLRRQRNLMVQSLDQYVFIYKALAEHHLFGQTDMTVYEFRQHHARLRQHLSHRERNASTGVTALDLKNGYANGSESRIPSPPGSPTPRLGNGTSGGELRPNGATPQSKAQQRRRQSTSPESARASLLDAEFQRLQLALEKPRAQTFASKEENRGRNRGDECVPYDNNRVILQPLLDYDNTYINATSVRGYHYPFILAQDPLGQETAFDFWRMVNGQNSCTLVMLSDESVWTRSEKYWPEDRRVNEYLGAKQELVLQLVSEERRANFIIRKLHYCFKGEESSRGREVVQYAVRRWPHGETVPQNIAGILDLASHVLDRQNRIADVGPVILHCRNGSTEASLFCAVCLLLERLRAERMIDVFNTVKTLQMQRPALITKLEQYVFLYDAVAKYLNTLY